MAKKKKPRKYVRKSKKLSKKEAAQRLLAQEGAREYWRKLKANKLPLPAKIATGSKEFRELQAKWYKKLSEDGFDDLEWTDNKTGIGQNSGYLKRSRSHIDPVHADFAETYYAMCRNWLSHSPKIKKYERFIFELHSEGIGYREILTQLKKKLNIKRSLFWLCNLMQKLKNDMIIWNQTNHEGLQVSRAEWEEAQAALEERFDFEDNSQ